VGFDLLHVSVGESGCGRSGVVVRKRGIEGGEALAVNASCCSVHSRKKSSGRHGGWCKGRTVVRA
jgi:hypothetical protein